MKRLAEEFRMSNEVGSELGSERGHCGAPVKGRGLAWPGERYTSGNFSSLVTDCSPVSSNARSAGLTCPNLLLTFALWVTQ
jgi:hypothetical protein